VEDKIGTDPVVSTRFVLATIFIIAALSIVALLVIGNPNPSQAGIAATTYSPSIEVFDSWYGQSFERDYHSCDAVALIIIRGYRDVQPQPNGELAISVGLTGEKQHIQINVDGTHGGCFG